MKLTHAFIALGLSAVCALAQNPPAGQMIPLLSQNPASTNSAPLDKEKTGYALVMMQWNSIKTGDLGVDYQSLIDGMTDALMDKKPMMTEQEAREYYGKW